MFKTAQKKSNTLFIVTSHLPPNSGGGVFRPYSFLKDAKKNNWQCHAFCFDYEVDNLEAGEYLLKQLEDKSVLHRIGLSNLAPSWKMTPHIDGGLANSLMMIQSIIKMKLDAPSVILATGPQFNSFLTGYFLARFYRAKLVLDYRDEWSLCPFSWVEKTNSDKIIEKWVCSKADRILFTTESHLLNHQDNFCHIARNKRMVLANGFDERDLASYDIKETKNNDFILSFIGALGDHSLPGTFLNSLESLLEKDQNLQNTLKIQFVGKKSARAKTLISEFKFQNNINLIDHVSKVDALSLMSASNALLILAGKGMKAYIPGKLFDYISLKKPILYFGEQGEASEIINNLKVGFSVDPTDEVDRLGRTFDDLIKNKIIIDKTKVDSWLKDYTRSYLAETLYANLNTLVDQAE